MSMFRTLANLLRKRDRLVDLSQGNDRLAFVESLGQCDIFVLAALTSEGLDAATFTQEQLLAEVEHAARHLSESDEFHPFVYEVDGLKRLPFFSTMDDLQTFCGEFSRERDRVFPFQTLGVSGATLASLADAADQLVLNDKTATMHALSEADIVLLRERWG